MVQNKFQALDARLEQVRKQNEEAQARAIEQRARDAANDQQFIRLANEVIFPTVEDFARYAKQKHGKIVRHDMQNNLNGDVFEIFLDHIASGPTLKLTHHAGHESLIVAGRGITVPSIPIKDVTAEWLIEKIVESLF